MRKSVFNENDWDVNITKYGVELVAHESLAPGRKEKTWQYYVSGLGSVTVKSYEGDAERSAALGAVVWYMIGHLPVKQRYAYVLRGCEGAPAVLFDMETMCMVPAWNKLDKHSRNIIITRCNAICPVGLPSAEQYDNICEGWWEKYTTLSEGDFMSYLKENGFY